MLRFVLVSFCLLWLSSPTAIAKPRIQLNAILNGSVVLTINGQQHMLKPGQKSPQGYQLVSIDEDRVQMLIEGKTEHIRLGATIGSSRAAPVHRVMITQDKGMFFTDGVINGQGVRFLVDTGATFLAINSRLAEQLGLDYKGIGQATMANTASGLVTAWRLTLNEVSVGQIQLRQVDAAVIEGDFPVTPLLGMSFLSRIKLQNDGQMLTLEQHFQ